MRIPALLVAVSCLAGPAALLTVQRRARTEPLAVMFVGGGRVEVPARSATVKSVLRAAGVHPRDGFLLSVVKGRVLDAHATPALVFVNRRSADLSRRVPPGARLRVVEGPDRIEPTEVRQTPVPPPAGPAVETHLWYPGAAGMDEAVVGTVSGEVVSSRRVAEPVAPRREEGNVVALTFDDGPDPTWTPQILQILAEEGVKATFCMVGDMVRKRPELTKTVLAQGQTLCTHTMSHPAHLDTLPPEEVRRQIVDGAEILRATTGQALSLYRSPAGKLTPAAIDIAHERGLRVLDWTVDSKDFQRPPAADLLQRILAAVRPGAVILLHDGGGVRSSTVEALRPLIQNLRAQGYQFTTPLAPPPPPPPPPLPPPPAPPQPPTPPPAT